jgi:hypothetical protein
MKLSVGQLSATMCAALLAACGAGDQTLPLIVDGDTVRITPSSTMGCPSGWSDAGFDDRAWSALRLPIASVQSSGVCLRKEFDIRAPLSHYRWLKIRLSTRSKARLNPDRPVTAAEERGGIDWTTDDDRSAATPSTSREYSLDLQLFPTLLQAANNVLALEVPQTNQAVQIEAVLQKDDGRAEGSAAVQRGPYLIHPTDRSVQIAWEAGRASPSWAMVDDTRRDGGWSLHHQALADQLLPGRPYSFWIENGQESVLPPGCRGVATHVASAPNDPSDDEYWRYFQMRDGCARLARAIHSEAARLHTPAPGGHLRVVVLGDTRAHGDATTVTRALMQRAALEAADLVVHTGDLVGTGSEADWQSFFDAGKAVWSSVAIAPVPGESEESLPLADRFAQLFGLDGSGLSGRSYAIDLGGVHLALVDQEARDAASWLDGDLAQAEAKAARILVVMHRGPYSSGTSQGDARALAELVPVLRRHRVDAVLSGHDNIYDHQLVDGRHYFVSGGAGPTIDTLGSRPATSVQASARPHYLMIDVAATGVTVQAKDEQGVAFDRVTLGN